MWQYKKVTRSPAQPGDVPCVTAHRQLLLPYAGEAVPAPVAQVGQPFVPRVDYLPRVGQHVGVLITIGRSDEPLLAQVVLI